MGVMFVCLLCCSLVIAQCLLLDLGFGLSNLVVSGLTLRSYMFYLLQCCDVCVLQFSFCFSGLQGYCFCVVVRFCFVILTFDLVCWCVYFGVLNLA